MGSAGPVKRGVNPGVRDLGVIVGMVDQGPRRAGSPSGARAGRCLTAGGRGRSGMRAGAAGGRGGSGRSGRRRGWLPGRVRVAGRARSGRRRGAAPGSRRSPGVGGARRPVVGEGAGDRRAPAAEVAGGLGAARSGIGAPAGRRRALPVRDDQVALPVGVAGVGGGELVGDVLALGEGLEGARQVALGHPHVAELVPADGEVALPLGVAGVGGGELVADVLARR